jgi:hypothetical protein
MPSTAPTAVDEIDENEQPGMGLEEVSPTHARDGSDMNKGSESEMDVIVDLEEPDAHLGVAKVQAAHRVYGKYSKWFLFLG